MAGKDVQKQIPHKSTELSNAKGTVAPPASAKQNHYDFANRTAVVASKEETHNMSRGTIDDNKDKTGQAQVPIVAPAGSLGAEQAKQRGDIEQGPAAPQKMEVVEPAKNNNVKAPDGRVNVDKVEVSHMVRGRSFVLNEESDGHDNEDHHLDGNDVLDKGKQFSVRNNKLFNAIMP